MKTDIAFDIDECMVDFLTPVKGVLKKLDLTFDESVVSQYDMLPSIKPKITRRQLYKIFDIAYMQPNKIPINDGAAELCTKLFNKTGDPVVFITQRPISSAFHTHVLVRRFCRVPHTIIFADPDYGKGAYLNGINYFVDDRRQTAMELAALGKTVMVPIKPWNENIDDDFEHKDSIVYIKNLKELIKNIKLFVK
jgi:hypothetical protein